jgi:hypothetical protein
MIYNLVEGLLVLATNIPVKTIKHPIATTKVTCSFKKIFPQIIPNTGRKYATVEVLTAPIFSINLI